MCIRDRGYTDFISFREVDPLLWTIVSNNMESPNDSLLRVLMCFLESGSMLPISRYCLVYLCTVERFIRYLSHISLIGRVAAIWITSFLKSLDRGVSAVFVYRKHVDNRKASNFGEKVCLTAVKLHMFGYQASHVCTQLEHVSALRWKWRYLTPTETSYSLTAPSLERNFIKVYSRSSAGALIGDTVNSN